MGNTKVDELALRILDPARPIEPPEGFSLSQLNSWMLGYAQCQHDLANIVRSYMNEQRDGDAH